MSIHTLSNGLRVVVEELPFLKSVSIGFLVHAGSSHENPKVQGISHFIEHMVFKGSKRYGAREVSELFDGMGGQINAHTTKEYTFYYAIVLAHHFEKAWHILSDIVLHALFQAQDIKTERQVILEEIKMYDDAPDEIIHDLSAAHVWKKHALGRFITGDAESVSAINRTAIEKFRSQYYQPDRMIVSIGGNVKTKQVIDQLEKTLGALKGKSQPVSLEKPTAFAGQHLLAKNTEQSHLCLAVPGPCYTDEKRYQLAVLSNILGGTMSSRLFQNVREKRGLAYSIYSYLSFYSLAGLLTIYAGMAHEKTKQVLELILSDLKKIKKEKIAVQELNRAKEQLKANLILGMETGQARMSYNARSLLYFDRILTADEIIHSVDQVTAHQVLELANQLFQSERLQLTALGKFPKKEIPELVC